jgi:hypothetical protein
MAVALDGGGAAGRQFQVEAIPQTVVIAPGGRIDRVFVGAPAGLRAGVEQAIRRLLDEVP